MPRHIAIFGGSFNPPGLHHRLVVEELVRQFDEVIVVPCGPRPDQPTTVDVDTVHRAALADSAFRDLPKQGWNSSISSRRISPAPTSSTPVFARAAISGMGRHRPTQGGGRGESAIQTRWGAGWRCGSRCNLLVVAGAHSSPSGDQPPPAGSSSSMPRGRCEFLDPGPNLPRERISTWCPARSRLHRAVRLYRAASQPHDPVRAREAAHPRLCGSTTNARCLAEPTSPVRRCEPLQLLVVIGGDGTMLRAIRAHWRRRLPFLGINAGHIGFLLNGADT